MDSVTTAQLKGALKAICDKLRSRGIDYHLRACLERDDRPIHEDKGLHLHIFLLLKSAIKLPNVVLTNNQ
jgi:hypothetical protein